jgi:RES domain-containing protein
MVLWRISRHLELSGIGGLRALGRWHHIGHPIIYLGTSPASALLEVCVHTTANNVPPNYTLIKVSVPEGLRILTIEDTQLPGDWQDSQNITRDLGTQWLRSNASPLLAVPGAIVPETINILLNPLHPEAAQCIILASQSYPFDFRLKR